MVNYDIKVEQGEAGAAEQKIREIYKNYLELMTDCAGSDEIRANFIENKHETLRNRVGMQIPEDVAIVLNRETKRWATLYAKTESGMVKISEQSLGVEITKTSESGKVEETVTLKPYTEVGVDIHDSLKVNGIRAVLELPFFDVAVDPLAYFKFGDGAETILMTC